MAQPKIGLALGGGGARGMAHIPVLQAFDDLELKPAAISGTSIGAIFGAAYAGGLSGTEIRDITLETFSDTNSVLGRLWKLRPRKFQDMFSGGLPQFDPLTVLETFVGTHLCTDFSDLKTPLTIMATDFYGCSERHFAEGPLLTAIAASIAIPVVFRPVRLDGRVLVDGGLVNPLPLDVLPADCDVIVGVDVIGMPVPRAGKETPSALDTMFGTSQILMQAITNEKLAHRQPDVLVRPDVGSVRVLDFLKTPQILEKATSLRASVRQRLEKIVT